MTIRADIDREREDRIALNSPYRDRELIKALPGARWSRDERVWTIPLSWAGCIQLRETFGQRLEVGQRLGAWAWEERRRRIDPALAVRDLADTHGDPQLWTFQRVGVEFLKIVGQALLGDDMGLGKTVQVVAAAKQLGRDALPILVVCPNSVKRSWERHFARWTPDLQVEVLTGGAAKRRRMLDAFEGDVLIVNWEALRLHSRLAPYGRMRLTRCVECGGNTERVGSCEVHEREMNRIQWGMVVADEAHRAKDPKAKQTRALWAVAHQQECYRYALTGTPIANTPDELWSLLHFLNPREWSTKTAYVDRYCDASFNVFGGLEVSGLSPRHRDEFYRIFDSRFIRRTKSQVMPNLPTKVYERRTVELTPKQQRAYDQMRDHYIARLDDGDTAITTNPLAHMTRLQQFASAYAEVTDEGLRLSEPSSKLDALMEIVDETAEPLVVFAESRQLIELAETRMERADIPYVSIRGGVSEQDRELGIQAFAAGQARVCLCTLGAGGEGVDGLQHGASVAVFLQRSWRLIANRQAEDRLHRGGQTRGVTIIDIIAEGTVEEWREARLAEKADNLEEILRDAGRLRDALVGSVADDRQGTAA